MPMVAGYELHDWSSILESGKNFSFLHQVETETWGPVLLFR